MARRRRASKIEILFETHSTTTDNERWVATVVARRPALATRPPPGEGAGRTPVGGRDRRGVLLGSRARGRERPDRIRRPWPSDLPRLAAARVQLRHAQRHRRGATRGRAHEARPRSVLGRGELPRRRRASAQLPRRSRAAVPGQANRRDRALGDEVGLRPSSRGRPSTSSSRSRSAGSRAGCTPSRSTPIDGRARTCAASHL